MRKLTKSLLVLGMASAMPVLTAWAQFNHSTWAIDEWGTAALYGSSVGQATGQLATEPISGMVTLSYDLGTGPVVQGDVILRELQTQEVSDLIRFAPDGRMYWFSLPEPGDLYPSLADVPQLPATWTNVVNQGEGLIGADYWPGAGMPGFDLTGGNLEYIFMTQQIPEPGSLGLLLVGAALLSLNRARREPGRRPCSHH